MAMTLTGRKGEIQLNGNVDDSSYGWIITVDKVDDGKKIGTCGPGNLSDGMEKLLKVSGDHRVRFQMFDDDGEEYYAGYLIIDESMSDGEEPYGPLGDYGMPYAGCAYITYADRPEFNCS